MHVCALFCIGFDRRRLTKIALQSLSPRSNPLTPHQTYHSDAFFLVFRSMDMSICVGANSFLRLQLCLLFAKKHNPTGTGPQDKEELRTKQRQIILDAWGEEARGGDSREQLELYQQLVPQLDFL